MQKGIIQSITNILVAAVGVVPYRTVIVDICLLRGGQMRYDGVVIHEDYRTQPIDLGAWQEELSALLLSQTWALHDQTEGAFNKAHFILDYAAGKLHYTVHHDADLQWLQTCPPDDPHYLALTDSEHQQITSWLGVLKETPIPWWEQDQEQT